MAHARWRRNGPLTVDLMALEPLLHRLQFRLATADLNSGFIFALPIPGMKYDERMMSLLITWSPRRLDGYTVEIRSNESKRRSNSSCQKLARLIAGELNVVMGC
ncbi:MAG: hypothetical protein VKL23_05420 [Cyanobacteriota bacterium]|jgi:hypothetical protein|nr:hypothetical protein [Cyanobacteriota bacterium]